MCLPKIITFAVIIILFIFSFMLWKMKRFKKYENYGALLLFTTTLCGLAFFCFDEVLVSTEHEDLFYYIELVVYLGIELIVSLIFLIVVKIKKTSK